MASLLGYQPRDVAISQEHLVGVPSVYRNPPLDHAHVATLGATSQLLGRFGFAMRRSVGSSPDFGIPVLRVIDRLRGRFPSLARRFSIVARKASV